ncbi:hypothetical protein [Duganella sp. Root1480D1]|uniref:hypothetical protein n=1 Tax=Duganella sp. Root1480D1 TaxID=1736471 RepID=UPI00070C4DBD|nr:hypothetical protein [Duganella sp. Root1480D1]KQZ40057.1 hypothetical protein ASD58_06680 [Duganella sp. Root1480D1]
MQIRPYQASDWQGICAVHDAARKFELAVLRAAGKPLSLDVLVGNTAALSLYQSAGFEIIDTVSGKLAGNEQFAATAHVLHFRNHQKNNST